MTKTTETKKTATCPSFSTILTLIFIVLKLTGHISWSWLWVLAPIWINFVVAGIICIVGLLVIKKKNK